jgi:two-component system NtrC family sensor kinase
MSSTSPRPSPTTPLISGHGTSPNLIARRIAVGFGLTAVVAVIMCAMLLSVIARTSGLVMDMRSDERAIGKSHALATAVREEYAHQAHTVIEGNHGHLAHYQAWVERISATVGELRPMVPEGQRWRLNRVLAMSQESDRVFKQDILPAVERGDRATVARLHRESDRISQAASQQADAIAHAVELRMVGAHISATHATRVGLGVGGLCVLIVLALSVGYTIRIRKAVLKPLAVIADSARRFGGGDFSVRVGAIGEGELRAVAEAFDRMVEELQVRERRALETERMAAIGQLAAGIAHEINNPIGIIRGYLKTMSADSPREQLSDELRILDEEAAACQRIADDLLAYARPPELRVSSTWMDELIVEVARRVEETDQPHRHPLDVRTQRYELVVDAGRLRQVLLNLLRNAAQVSPPNASIEIAGRREGGNYEITVSGRGPGVDPQNRTRIFEPFFSNRAGGVGLGLAVSQGIVRAHGGTIEVGDRVGGGATFHVRIPIVRTSGEKPSA